LKLPLTDRQRRDTGIVEERYPLKQGLKPGAVSVKDGLCTLFVLHTTAGITINENADPSVKADMLKELNKIVPFEDGYSHMEGNAAAHIKSTLVGQTVSVFIEDGAPVLGTWQGIFFCEFDGPRQRKVLIKIT